MRKEVQPAKIVDLSPCALEQSSSMNHKRQALGATNGDVEAIRVEEKFSASRRLWALRPSNVRWGPDGMLLPKCHGSANASIGASAVGGGSLSDSRHNCGQCLVTRAFAAAQFLGDTSTIDLWPVLAELSFPLQSGNRHSNADDRS